MATAYVEVPLSGKKSAGRVAQIDVEDYEMVIRHKWHVLEVRRKGRTNGPYARTAILQAGGGYKIISMHSMITGYPRTDHIFHNTLDNRRHNLRDGLHNDKNRRPDLTSHGSKYKGVGWNKQMGKWRARITVNGKTRTILQSNSQEACARAYNEAALEAFGEHAYLNPLPS